MPWALLFQPFRLKRGVGTEAGPSEHRRQRGADSSDDRWREFKIAEVRERQFKLDGFKWLKEDSLEDADDLPDPDELAGEAIGELQGAVEELNEILALLASGGKRWNPLQDCPKERGIHSMAAASLTPRVRLMAVCDRVRESKSEAGVFDLRGVRRGLAVEVFSVHSFAALALLASVEPASRDLSGLRRRWPRPH